MDREALKDVTGDSKKERDDCRDRGETLKRIITVHAISFRDRDHSIPPNTTIAAGIRIIANIINDLIGSNVAGLKMRLLIGSPSAPMHVIKPIKVRPATPIFPH